MPDTARGFSARTAAFLVVSSTVGGGIFGTAGYVALDAGGHAGAMLVWLVGGLIAACGALALAEVSASLPRSGGEYAILGAAYGPLAGFLGGWVSLVFGFIGPIAATASASASYLLAPVTGEPPLGLVRLGATVLIVALALIHSTGRRGAEGVQGVATGATIGVLALFIVAGLWAASSRGFLAIGRPARMSPSGFFVGLIRASYAYTGWNAASYVAGEVVDPRRTLPRAILLGTAIVVALYLGLAAVFAASLPHAELREIAAGDRDALERIGDLAAVRLFGPMGARMASLAVGLVLAASLSALLLTGPRVARAMAEDRRLPRPFARVTRSGGMPAVAIAGVALAAVGVLWSGGFEAITFAMGVGLALNSLLTVGAVFVLRRRRPDLARPFKTPGYPIVPMAFLAMTAAALVASALDPAQWSASLAGVAGVLAGVPLFWLTRRRGRAA